jgi:hypothetical protein
LGHHAAATPSGTRHASSGACSRCPGEPPRPRPPPSWPCRAPTRSPCSAGHSSPPDIERVSPSSPPLQKAWRSRQPGPRRIYERRLIQRRAWPGRRHEPLELVELHANSASSGKQNGCADRKADRAWAPGPASQQDGLAPQGLAVVLSPTGPPCGHRAHKHGLSTPCRVAGEPPAQVTMRGTRRPRTDPRSAARSPRTCRRGHG